MARIVFMGPRLHPGQETVTECTARFRVLCCGRRWGKTLLGATESVREGTRGKRAWWIGPSYRQGMEGWHEIKRQSSLMPGAKIREADKSVEYPGGGMVEVRTADDPHRLRGAGLDFVVLDECREMKPETWAEVIRPALMDRKGRALFISTPQGRDWFHDLYRLGEEGADGWASFTFSTFDNPTVERAEIDAFIHGHPERLVRQEIYAEFIEDGSGVFRRVRECSTAQPEPGVPGAEYVTFVDLAEVNDFNAVCTLRIDGPYRNKPCQVHADRWNKVDWPVSKARIAAVGRQYPGTLNLDITGQLYGDDRVRDVQETAGYGCRVGGTKLDNARKHTWVSNFAAALESDRVVLLAPDSGEVAMAQMRELQDYAAEKTPSGNVRYNAPSGRHDDLAVACYVAYALFNEIGGDPYAAMDAALGGSMF